MAELEERLRRYAAAVIEATPAVTVEEARQAGPRRRRWVVAVALAAAAVVVVAGGVVGLLVTAEDDGQELNTISGEDMPLTLDGHRDWMLAVLNGRTSPTDDAIRSRYSTTFLGAVPPDELRRVIEEVRRLGPWRILAEVERRGEEVVAVQLVAADGQQARLTLRLGAGGRVEASTILLATPCAAPVPATTPLSPPLADQLSWTQELLASDRAPSDDELRGHFAASFLSAVPLDQLRGGIDQIRELGPLTLRSFEGPPSEHALTARLGVRTGEEARLSLTVAAQPPHQITGLTVLTQQPCRIPDPAE